MRLFVLSLLLVSAPVSAQRARRERWTPPVTPMLVGSGEGPYEVLLGIRVSGDAEVVTDWRRFDLEVQETVAGRRRPRVHHCRGAGVGRREVPLAVRFHAGDAWGVRIDLRSLCWGRALRAVEAGGTITVVYGAGRGRGAWIARGPNGETARELSAPSTFVVHSEAPDAAGSGITLAPVDARGRRFTFRVAVFGPDEGVRRAWVRPDSIRFGVVDPEGARWECTLPPTGAAPIPDLFARISRRRAVRFSLDAAEYCPDVFRRAGVYEVTPIAELEEDGAAWRLNAVVGRLVGTPVAVRVRGGEGAVFTELSSDDARRLLR